MSEVAEVTVRERIGRSAGSLTPSERKVALALQAAYPIAGLETITQLAQRARVSGPTVTRFVNKLHFEGYRDFQQALRREVQERVSSPVGRYQQRGRAVTGEGVLRSTLEALTRVLDSTSQGISPAEFEAVVELLADPKRRVWCTGGRVSQVAAYHLFARLHQLRPGTRYLATGPIPRVDELIQLGRRDVLVVFEYRRYQPDTVEFAAQAAKRGVTVVLATDRWISPVADDARHVLVAAVETASPFDSLVPGVAIVEALVAALVARLGESARARIAELDVLRGGSGWPEPGWPG
jgi:DNA-binding MurR/RpiR family transcriptional regulator